MAYTAAIVLDNRRLPTLRAPFAVPIRPWRSLVQMDVLKICAYPKKYRQNLTVSLPGYPRGYTIDLQQLSLCRRIPLCPAVFSDPGEATCRTADPVASGADRWADR
jgi:hypothetical protein